MTGFNTNNVPTNITKILERKWEPRITFLNEDVVGVLPYNNDFMVLLVQYDNWDVKHVLIDPGNSTYVLFKSAFQRFRLNPYNIRAF